MYRCCVRYLMQRQTADFRLPQPMGSRIFVPCCYTWLTWSSMPNKATMLNKSLSTADMS